MARPGAAGERSGAAEARSGGSGQPPRTSGERLVVAHVKAAHGIRGAVLAEALSDDPARFVPGARLFREGDARPLTIAESRQMPRGTIVRFEEIADRSAAEALRDRYLEAEPRRVRRRGEYLWHEVVGTRVEDRSGRPLGTVREVFRAGGGEVAVVNGPDGELLVPLVRAFVPRFAPRRGVMTIDRDRLGIGEPDADAQRRPHGGPIFEVDVVTLFPAMLEGLLAESIPGRVQEQGIAIVRLHDLRRWGLGRHRSVDDYTFGGGAGMVLRPEPVAAALEALRRPGSVVILLDPTGERFGQAMARELAQAGHLILVCGRYEGVDERIRDLVDREVSIGDYVLSGGEPAALVVIDAVLRLLPGAIEAASTEEESFAGGLLEYPQYTRPREFGRQRVPDVLVSGDHEAIDEWRLKEALRRTRRRRPDLLTGRQLTPRERELLADIEQEEEASSGEGSGP